MVKNPPVNAGDTRDLGSIPGWRRSLRVGRDNLLQYSCLENSMVREAWWATVHRVSKSQTLGNTCKPMAVSFQCMTKFTTNKIIIIIII